MVSKTISMLWTAVHFLFTCHAWLDLWTVNLYSSLQGNKNYLELVGNLSYRGFELPRVKL